jgi:hypothetical protein
MQTAKRKLQIADARHLSFCNLQFAICNSRPIVGQSRHRAGGVYLAVLGTSLIVSVLALSTLTLQRIQNRMLTDSDDICQAHRNAQAAVELGLLEMRQNASWRTTNTELEWFDPPRTAGAGICQLEVDDANAPEGEEFDGLSADSDLPVRLVGIGQSGKATQHLEVVVDPQRNPHASLQSGSTAQPDWTAVFQHYQTLGTAININSLGPPQLARNGNFAATTLSPYWTGDITGIADDADIEWIEFSGSQYLRVFNREGPNAGAAQRISTLIKANTTYSASIKVWNGAGNADRYRISFYADPSSATAPVPGSWSNLLVTSYPWLTSGTMVSVQFTTPNWTASELANAIVIVQSQSYANEFRVDDLSLTQNTTDKYIYRQVLGPGQNPYGTANANGIYCIDCGGQTLVIERSRIAGTLLVLNPGANSRIGDGPIHWSPATPGFPTLLVNGNFVIQATNADLSESQNAVNYNPAAVPYYGFSPTTDDLWDDAYPVAAALQGLIGVSGNLTYQNSPQMTGRVIVGGTVSGTPNFTYRPDSLLSPPPTFYDYRYERRSASTRKSVLP